LLQTGLHGRKRRFDLVWETGKCHMQLSDTIVSQTKVSRNLTHTLMLEHCDDCIRNCPRAAAIAVEDGVIATRSGRALIGPWTQVINAARRTIVPGFIDSHMHPRAQFEELGPYGRLDLTPEAGVVTRDDLCAKLPAKIALENFK
jgi:hypothetical protein